MATDRTTAPGSAAAVTSTALHSALALRPREAAKALGISERMLWSLTAPRGTIPAVRIGTCVLYPVTGLQAQQPRSMSDALSYTDDHPSEGTAITRNGVGFTASKPSFRRRA